MGGQEEVLGLVGRDFGLHKACAALRRYNSLPCRKELSLRLIRPPKFCWMQKWTNGKLALFWFCLGIDTNQNSACKSGERQSWMLVDLQYFLPLERGQKELPLGSSSSRELGWGVYRARLGRAGSGGFLFVSEAVSWRVCLRREMCRLMDSAQGRQAVKGCRGPVGDACHAACN